MSCGLGYIIMSARTMCITLWYIEFVMRYDVMVVLDMNIHEVWKSIENKHV